MVILFKVPVVFLKVLFIITTDPIKIYLDSKLWPVDNVILQLTKSSSQTMYNSSIPESFEKIACLNGNIVYI